MSASRSARHLSREQSTVVPRQATAGAPVLPCWPDVGAGQDLGAHRKDAVSRPSKVQGAPANVWLRHGQPSAKPRCFRDLLRRSGAPLLRLPASLLAVALTGQRLFDAEFLAGLQVEGVPFDFPNDVLRNDLPLEAAERVLNSLAFLEPYVSQTAPPPRPNSCAGIIRTIRTLPSSESSLPEPASPSVPCWA